MSVITYKEGIMASDSLTTYDNGLINSTSKITKGYDYLIGSVGQLDSSEYFIYKLFETIKEKDRTDDRLIYNPCYNDIFKDIVQKMNLKEEDHFQVMIIHRLRPKNIYSLSSRGISIFLPYNMEKDKNKPPYFTIGAASRYAHAALHIGKSAIEAAQIASELSIYCGGSIQSLSF